MDIRLLMREHDETMQEMQTICEKAVSENRDMSPDEKNRLEQLQAHSDRQAAQIAQLQEIDRGRAGIPRNQPKIVPQVRDPNASRVPENWPQMAGCYRSQTGPFTTFGEQLQAIARASVPGNRADNRLLDVESRQAGMNEGIGSEGGFMVQTDFSAELLKNMFAVGQLASRCQKFTISTDSNAIKVFGIDETSRVEGSRFGGVRVYNKGEGEAKIATHPKVKQIELKLGKKVGLCYASDELVADANLLGQIVARAFTEEMAFKVDQEIVSGTGVGQFLGILNSPALIAVAPVGGAPADEIQYVTFLNMVARFSGNMRSGAFLANKDTLPAIFDMVQTIGVGGQLVFQAGDVDQGRPPVLLGFPVLWCEQCESLGTQGDLILADLSAYALADKAVGIETAISMHVRFIEDEQAFRFVYRCDGQPLYASAVSPAHGTDTVSPFICIETR